MEKHTHTILLVDDEHNILNSLLRVLRKEGYKILTANNSNEGLEILKNEPVSLILSDHRMPGLSGVDLLRKVKKLYPNTIRIILSGYTEVNTLLSAINEGEIYKFIAKPWNDEELRLTVRHAIEQFELKEENKRLIDEIKGWNNELERKIEESNKDIIIKNQALMFSQTILESLPIGIMGIGSDGIISFINTRGRELLQQSCPLLGNKIDDILPEEIVRLVNDTFKKGSKQELLCYNINNSNLHIITIPISIPSTSSAIIIFIPCNKT